MNRKIPHFEVVTLFLLFTLLFAVDLLWGSFVFLYLSWLNYYYYYGAIFLFWDNFFLNLEPLFDFFFFKFSFFFFWH